MADGREKGTRLMRKQAYDTSTPSDNVRRSKRAGSISTYQSSDMAALRGPPKLENTYQLGPRLAFPTGQVQRIIKKILAKYLEHEQYKADLCAQMSKQLSEVIRARVKEITDPRYRLVCVVHIGQLGNQCMRIASRCLWDSSCDKFASFEFTNSSLFAVCTVYGVYVD